MPRALQGRTASPPGRGAGRLLAGAAALALSVLLLAAASPRPVPAADGAEPVALVVTEVPAAGPAEPCGPGARLVRIGPDGARTILSAELAAACDPALDPASSRLYFAGRETPDDRLRVWELELATGARRVLSPGDRDCRHPAPLPAGTGGTDPSAPASPVVFACGGDLYRSPARSGGPADESERLTFSQGALSEPSVLPDGRLLVAARPPGGAPRLLTALPDGTWVTPFRDAPFPGLLAARPTAGDDLLVALSANRTGDGGSGLTRFSVSDPFAPPRPWGPAGGWQLRDPVELPGGSLLAAGRAVGGAREPFRLVRLDGPAGEPVAAAATPLGFHALQPLPLAPRPGPAPLPSIVKPELNTGYLVLFDAARSDEPSLAGLDRSRVAAVRIFPGGGDPSSPEAVDVAPAPDGSLFLEVPADRPLGLALIDTEGRVLARTGIPLWVRPNERRACLGCHVSARYAPPNVRPLALQEAARWIGWGAERRGPRSELEGMP